MNKFLDYCVAELSKIRPNATFLTIKDYVNNFEEHADVSLLFHVSYAEAVRRSLLQIKKFSSALPSPDCGFSEEDLRQARDLLMESLSTSLKGPNPAYTCEDVYARVVGPDGKFVPGIKIHKKNEALYLQGFRIHKRILQEGRYSPDNRFPLTKAKDWLRSQLPIGKWAQYKVVPGKFKEFTVENLTISAEEILNHDERTV